MTGLFEIQPGTKNQMLVKVENTHLKMPLTIVAGRHEGPTLLVTTGLHGSEYVPTLALVELVRGLDPEEVRGRLIALHPVNTQAFQARMSLMLPEDGADLDQTFPGRPDGGASARAAWRVTEFQALADFHLDLRGGDLHEDVAPHACYPGVGSPPVVAASRLAARAVNVPWLVRTEAPGRAVTSAALRGTPALALVRGTGGSCSPAEVALYREDVRNLFRHLGLLADAPATPPAAARELPAPVYARGRHSALWRPAVEPGQAVAAGQKLGELLDYFGQTLEVVQAERAGVVLMRLRTLAANAGDVLVAY